MRLKGYARTIFALALCCVGLFGQTVTSSLVGTVVDPKGAPVADAPVTLTNAGTSAARLATTDSHGVYLFPEVDAGSYFVTVKAPGYKAATQSGVVVLAQEPHNSGQIALVAGSVADFNVTPALAAQVQSGSSETSGTISETNMEDLTLKGRDLFGYLKLIPGVVDTTASRDVTAPGNLAGISIGGNTSAINFNVDGVTSVDTGNNQNAHFEPNVDSIQEIRVLASNYEAEYGRNSGGIVTVITKSGTQDLHGTGSWTHRNQEFNANSWANNHTLTPAGTATPRDAYKFNVETYGIGGPVYIPKVANVERKRLFFFFSQERTAQFVPAPTQMTYMPTALERTGNFSQTFANVNGNASVIPVLDPLNGNVQFAANTIPTSRINGIGQQLISFFPTPNFTPTLSNQLYTYNYFEQGSEKHPRRNDVLRLDSSVTSKINAYFRWVNDTDSIGQLFQGVPFSQYAGSSSLTANMSSINQLNPGHGYLGTITGEITPTLINEFSVARSQNQLGWYTTDNYASEASTLEPSLPTLFTRPAVTANGLVSATNGYHSLLPTFSFGGSGLPSSAYYLRNSATAGAAEDFNKVWTIKDNVSKVLGHHAFKAGFYGERTTRIQPAGQNYNGAYSFAASSSVPFLNSNDGFVNALLGNVNSFSQYTATTASNILYYNEEFYLQDHWKVNRRLTVDFGIRFYHQTPPTDHNNTFVNFVPSAYKKASMSRIYYPYCASGVAPCSSAANGLVARDGLTGALVSSAYIGDLVYGSGNPVTGMVRLGVGGVSGAPYQQPSLGYGPRFGFAWDVFGDGKTAIRGGWGLYRNRLASNTVDGLAGQSPLSFQQTVNNVTFAQISAANTGASPDITNLTLAPVSPTSWPSSVPFEGVGNASLGIQRIIDKSTTLDIGYMLNYSYDQYLTYDINYIPIGTSWPFTKSNLSAATSGNSSADVGSIYERTLYPGYGNINGAAFLGKSNYTALTASLNRRISRGLAVAVAYTWSKADGITTYSPEVANNTTYNYGRLATDRRNNLQLTYSYNIPGIAGKLGFKKLGYLTDHWQLSGIASFQSGAPYNPTCGVTNGQAAPASYTGTPDLTARCNVIGNPLTGTGSNGNGKVFFNAAAFALPALGTGPNNSIVGSPVLGNLGGGAGVLSLPSVTNVDATLTRNIPLGEKRVLKLQAQAYNVFNHTEIGNINSAIQFNPTTNVVSNPSGVGFINSALPNRILSLAARIVF